MKWKDLATDVLKMDYSDVIIEREIISDVENVSRKDIAPYVDDEGRLHIYQALTRNDPDRWQRQIMERNYRNNELCKTLNYKQMRPRQFTSSFFNMIWQEPYRINDDILAICTVAIGFGRGGDKFVYLFEKLEDGKYTRRTLRSKHVKKAVNEAQLLKEMQ